jgi:hypothetical protein
MSFFISHTVSGTLGSYSVAGTLNGIFDDEYGYLYYGSFDGLTINGGQVFGTGPGGGTLNLTTGAATVSLSLVAISVPSLGFFTLNLTTGTSGSLTGTPYSEATDSMTLVDGTTNATLTLTVTLTEIPDPLPEPDPTLVLSGYVRISGSVQFERKFSLQGVIGFSGSVSRPRRFTDGLDFPDFEETVDGIPIDYPEGVPEPTSTAVRRRVVIVDMYGAPVTQGFLADATMSDISWTRSSPASFSVTLPLNSDSARMLLGDGSDRGVDTPYREAQLWRGDQLLSWGPLHSMSVDGDVLELQGNDASWYLTRRSIGPNGRVNLIENGDLTHDTDGWYGSVQIGWGNPPSGNSPLGNINRTRLPSDPKKWGFRIENRFPFYQEVNSDEYSLTSTLSPAWVTAQTFFTIPPQQVATKLTFSCWIDVEELISRSEDDSAIFIGLFPPTGRRLEDLIAVEYAGFPDDIQAGQRFRAEVSIDVPAGQFLWGVASVRSCRGVSYASDFWLEWDGGLAYLVRDKAEIMRDLVHHLSGSGTGSAQANGYPLRPFHGPATYGKSDVRIRPSVARSGYNLSRVYSFSAGGGDGIGALTDLAEDDAASGWQMQFSHTTRWWHTMRNTGIRWDCPMRWVPSGGNLHGFAWQYMGEQGANVVNVFSAYPGSRAQGTAIDPNAFGGLTLEDALTAVEDTWDDSLQAWADTHLFGTTRPVSLALKLSARPYFTRRGLGVGQVVPVTIVHGAMKIAGLYRIHSMTLTADDHLELTVTPAAANGVPL